MTPEQIHPRIVIAGVPLHAMLVPFPIACFTGALMTDIAYANSAQIYWADFSAWLLAFGTFMGAVAALFGLLDLTGRKRGRKPAIAWWHMGGNIVLLLIALLNNFIHARDGWTSVVPAGLTLSAIMVLLMIMTGFLGHRLAYRHVRMAGT